jgi:hypothetical protein
MKMALFNFSRIFVYYFIRTPIFISISVDPKSVKNAKDLPYMQRPGGSADDSDIKGKKKGGMFSFGKKKAEPAPEPEKKKKNMFGF